MYSELDVEVFLCTVAAELTLCGFYPHLSCAQLNYGLSVGGDGSSEGRFMTLSRSGWREIKSSYCTIGIIGYLSLHWCIQCSLVSVRHSLNVHPLV